MLVGDAAEVVQLIELVKGVDDAGVLGNHVKFDAVVVGHDVGGFFEEAFLVVDEGLVVLVEVAVELDEVEAHVGNEVLLVADCGLFGLDHALLVHVLLDDLQQEIDLLLHELETLCYCRTCLARASSSSRTNI